MVCIHQLLTAVSFNSPAKQSRRQRAQQRRLTVVHPQNAALAQSQHRHVAHAQPLFDAMLARLALMPARRIGIQVMRIDVERHQAERLKAGRIHDRHVVCRVDRARGHVRSGAAAHVRQLAGEHTTSDRLDQAGVVQMLEQLERVAAANENAFGLLDGLGGVGQRVDAHQFRACQK